MIEDFLKSLNWSEKLGVSLEELKTAVIVRYAKEYRRNMEAKQ